jgi:hypothetical protein
MVYGTVRHVDRLHPKPVRSLVLIKPGSYHLNESPILPFGHPILLWSVGGRKLMLDAFFIKIVFYLSIFELAPITSNFLDFSIKFILRSIQEIL